MATLKFQSAPAGLVWLLQKATAAPGCFTSSEKGAKKSLYVREQIMVLFVAFESHMLEIELCLQWISLMVKAQHMPKTSPM